MTTPEKKAAVCKRCAADKATVAPRRRCDEGGCGRVGCIHLIHRKDGKDVCGPCNLRNYKARAKAAKAAPPEVKS